MCRLIDCSNKFIFTPNNSKRERVVKMNFLFIYQDVDVLTTMAESGLLLSCFTYTQLCVCMTGWQEAKVALLQPPRPLIAPGIIGRHTTTKMECRTRIIHFGWFFVLFGLRFHPLGFPLYFSLLFELAFGRSLFVWVFICCKSKVYSRFPFNIIHLYASFLLS